MSTEETKKPDAPASSKYKVSTGAAAILAEILPTTQWYKDEAKQGQLICRAFAACEAIPDLPDRPRKDKEELDKDFESRVEKWAAPEVEFEWTDKQKEAVRACMRHYLKQGAFMVTGHAIQLLKLLALDDE